MIGYKTGKHGASKRFAMSMSEVDCENKEKKNRGKRVLQHVIFLQIFLNYMLWIFWGFDKV